MDEFIGGSFVEFEFAGVPFQLRFWEAGRYAAHQDSFRQQTGVIEIGGSAAEPAAGLNKFAVVIAVGNGREFEVLEFFVRIKERTVDVRQNESAIGANENGPRFGPFIAFKQRKNIGGRFGVTVVPGDIDSFAGCTFSATKYEMDVGIDRPIPIVWRRSI